jgi:peptidyl-prolyl cis-trans isomerase SurA
MRLGAFAFLLSALTLHADVTVIEEIIAKVNGDIITRSEIARTREQLLEEHERRGTTGAELEAALKQQEADILRDRIDQLLVIQKGKELSVNVDAEVSKEMARIQEQFKIGDPDKFADFVREQTGLSSEDFRQEMRNRFMFERVIRQEVGGRVTIPSAELRKYYEEHKGEFQRDDRIFLREIFISTEGMDANGAAAAEKKARDLVARARRGERFGDLARDNSDSASGANHGELLPLPKNDLREDLRALVWDQPRGTVTDPVKQGNGFLILRVEDQHKAGLADFEEVQNEIMEKLYYPRFQPRIREYLTELRNEAFLEIKPGYVDTASAQGKDTSWSDPLQLRPEMITKEEIANIPPRRKRMLWMVPFPGTQTEAVSSSQ